MNWHFGVIGLRISFWIFFSYSSFGTIILLLWFLIFKLLSIFKPNDFFIFSLSSDFNFLTKFSGIDFFFFFYFFICTDVNLKYKYENNSKVLELQSLNTKTNKGVIVAMVACNFNSYRLLVLCNRCPLVL